MHDRSPDKTDVTLLKYFCRIAIRSLGEHFLVADRCSWPAQAHQCRSPLYIDTALTNQAVLYAKDSFACIALAEENFARLQYTVMLVPVYKFQAVSV